MTQLKSLMPQTRLKSIFSLLCFIFFGFNLLTQVPLKPLYEEFTSSTCTPCAYVNSILEPVLHANESTHTAIKYQVNFPGDGDPYYIDHTGVRMDYYDVSFAPNLYINANEIADPEDFTQSEYDSYLSEMTYMEIDITSAEIDENNIVTISADFNALADYAAGLKAHIVVVEKRTVNNNIGNTSEVEFFNVIMQMLPNTDGTTLPAMSNGQSETVAVSFDMNSTFMEGANDLAVVAFVQDDTDKSIIQSGDMDIEGEFITYNLTFDVKDSNGEIVEDAEIFLQDHGIEFSDALGIHTYEGVFSGSFEYEVTYPGLLDAIGTVTLADTDITEYIVLDIPDYFYYEDFSTGIPGDYTLHVGNGSDAIYEFEGTIIFFRQSGTLEPLVLVSPSFEIANDNDGSIIFNLGGVYGDVETGFGTISDASDPSTLNEFENYIPGESFQEYEYDLQSFVDSPGSVNFYWNLKTSDFSWFEMQYVIITDGALNTTEMELLKDVKVFPNPASDALTIQLGLLIEEISIYDSVGQIVQKKKVNAHDYQLNTSDYKSGYYFIIIHTEKGQVMKTVVIN